MRSSPILGPLLAGFLLILSGCADRIYDYRPPLSGDRVPGITSTNATCLTALCKSVRHPFVRSPSVAGLRSTARLVLAGTGGPGSRIVVRFDEFNPGVEWIPGRAYRLFISPGPGLFRVEPVVNSERR